MSSQVNVQDQSNDSSTLQLDNLDSFLQLLTSADKDGDGEIDWDDFKSFCVEQDIPSEKRDVLWHELGGDVTTKVSPQKVKAQLTAALTINDSDNVFHSQDDDDEEDEDGVDVNMHSDPLIVELEISENSPLEVTSPSQHQLQSDGIKDTDTSDNSVLQKSNSKHRRSLSEGCPVLSPIVYNGLKDIAAMFSKYDIEDSGILSQSEFILFLKELYPNIGVSDILLLFKLLDKNDCDEFRYNEHKHVQQLQQRLNAYSKTMLTSAEFCAELKNVYCTSSSLNSAEALNDKRDEEDDGLTLAYNLKKEMDFALASSTSTHQEKITTLGSTCRDLWRWIQNVGVASLNTNAMLHQEISTMAAENAQLNGELAAYQQRLQQVKTELNAVRHDKDALQIELQLMACQLSQEQGFEADGNSNALRASLSALSVDAMKLRQAPTKWEHDLGTKSMADMKKHPKKIVIQSQHRKYTTEVDDVEHDSLSDDEPLAARVRQHRRDESYELPSAVCMLNKDGASVATSTDREDMYILQTIQTNLNQHHEKLNVIIELIKSLDTTNEQRKQNTLKIVEESIRNMKQGQTTRNESTAAAACGREESVSSGMKPALPVLATTIACLVGYATLRYQKRR